MSVVTSLINVAPVKDPDGLLDLSYNICSDFNIPKITIHFIGADVKLIPLNTFIRISKELLCLIFKGFDQGPTIYDNLVQMNFLVGYDTKIGRCFFNL